MKNVCFRVFTELPAKFKTFLALLLKINIQSNISLKIIDVKFTEM